MTTTFSAAVAASDPPALTIYRADGDGLFDTGSQPIAEGRATVHESRTLPLSGGRQTLVIGGMPRFLDTEAVSIDLGDAGRVLAQRVLSAGDAGVIAAHRGERIEVRSAEDHVLASGTLVAIDGNGQLGVRGDDGRIVYVRDFARASFPESGGQLGSTLQVVVDGKAGNADVGLAYPTSGLGWRASYSALLADVDARACSLRLSAQASIANRSGRDYAAARLKLVAGSPNFAKHDRGVGYSGGMMMMKTAAAPESAPEQSDLGDYRTYLVDGALDLPDASVTQIPLHDTRDIACERRWLYETGGAWFPQKPMVEQGGDDRSSGPVSSRVTFTAADNLPAGILRVFATDKDGRRELLGENRLGDTAKGRPVDIDLGVAFELSAERERTAFTYDRNARTIHESFRITLHNSGSRARSVSVREHPNRWRAWTLASSTVKPEKQTPDTLEFRVDVPANGKATLEYTVLYTWQPQEG